MQLDRKTGLVLEGGGMRSVFTSGVLDAFLKNECHFRYVVAVSAGACNGMSYISRQPRRARISNIDMLAKYDYLGVHQLFKHGCIYDPELLYERFPNEIVPFDYDTYFNNSKTFEIVTTNCLTGCAEYLTESSDRKRAIDIVHASSSLPYVCKSIEVDDVPMLDGGIVDSIPVMRAISQGYTSNVVICTRNRGYRATGRDRKIPKFIYRKYPRLRVALSRRIAVYNQQLELVEKLEDEGRIICIRPQHEMEVERMTKDICRLEALYEEGFKIGCAFCDKYS